MKWLIAKVTLTNGGEAVLIQLHGRRPMMVTIEEVQELIEDLKAVVNRKEDNEH